MVKSLNWCIKSNKSIKFLFSNLDPDFWLLSRSETEPHVLAVMDVKSPVTVKKVPIRVIHTESSSGQERQVHLHQSSEACSIPEPSLHISTLSPTEHSVSSSFLITTCRPEQEPEQGSELSQESMSTDVQHLEDEVKREELARDIMDKDKSLVDILDQSGRKTTMDLMEGLFPPEKKILEGAQQRRRASAVSRLPTSNRWDILVKYKKGLLLYILHLHFPYNVSRKWLLNCKVFILLK